MDEKNETNEKASNGWLWKTLFFLALLPLSYLGFRSIILGQEAAFWRDEAQQWRQRSERTAEQWLGCNTREVQARHQMNEDLDNLERCVQHVRECQGLVESCANNVDQAVDNAEQALNSAHQARRSARLASTAATTAANNIERTISVVDALTRDLGSCRSSLGRIDFDLRECRQERNRCEQLQQASAAILH